MVFAPILNIKINSPLCLNAPPTEWIYSDNSVTCVAKHLVAGSLAPLLAALSFASYVALWTPVLTPWLCGPHFHLSSCL